MLQRLDIKDCYIVLAPLHRVMEGFVDYHTQSSGLLLNSYKAVEESCTTARSLDHGSVSSLYRMEFRTDTSPTEGRNSFVLECMTSLTKVDYGRSQRHFEPTKNYCHHHAWSASPVPAEILE
jgi:hypothetical protein